MEVVGKISKINSDLGYGFIANKDHDEIFFSADTAFVETSFEKLAVNEPVRIQVEQTERGPFARTLAPAALKKPSVLVKKQTEQTA